MMTVIATARPTGHPGYSETLPREPASATAARRLVRPACAVWGLERAAEDGALIISELVSNAVQHARRESIHVVVERTALRTVRVAVADFSQTRPVQREAEEGDEGGRGLLIVATLAVDWGTGERRWGRSVWAELSSSPNPQKEAHIDAC